MPTGHRHDQPRPHPAPVRSRPPGGSRIHVEPAHRAGVAGICRDSLTRLALALSGVGYPADKWELIAYAEQHAPGQPRLELRTVRVLWALPAGRYVDLPSVIAGAAWTVRGHPRRDGHPAVRREAEVPRRRQAQVTSEGRGEPGNPDSGVRRSRRQYSSGTAP